MSITNGYTEFNTYRQRFYDADHQTDSEDEDAIESVITAISRAIDDITARRFYATTETRYFTADRHDYLRVFDLLSITTSKLLTDEDGDRVYEQIWATTDYDLMPFNASLDGEPYTWITLTPNGDYSFPLVSRGVSINGSFGYSSTTPPAVEEACLLSAHRLMKRANTPLGVSGSTNLAQVNIIIKTMAADPDIMGLLMPYVKRL
jgi:hypothetical protein